MNDGWMAKFTSLHTEKPAHMSLNDAFKNFAESWSNYVSDSRRNAFTKFETDRSYPISKDDVSGSAYLRRPDLENKILHAYSGENDIVILGNEGAGKTTLVNYAIGVLSYGNDRNTIRSYVDVRQLNFDDDDLVSTQFARYMLGALHRTRINGRNIAWHFDKKYDIFWNSLSRSLRETLEQVGNLKPLITCLCFIAHQFRNSNIVVVIDNIDSLSFESTRRIIDVASVVKDTYNDICSRLDRNENKIKYIMPCRYSTYEYISNSQSGIFPFDGARRILIGDSKFDCWELTRQYIENSPPVDGDQISLFRSAITRIQIGPGITIQISQSMAEIISDMIDWIRKNSPGSHKIIENFSGHSIRRSKAFCLKILTNAAIVQLFYKSKHFPISSPVINDVIKEALFDLNQPFADKAHYSDIVLNPFRVVKTQNLRTNSPFIGICLLYWLNRDFVEPFSSYEEANVASFQEIYDKLCNLGYQKTAISEAVSSFCMSGLMSPVKGSSKILSHESPNRTIYDKYVIDTLGIGMFYRLAFYRERKNADQTGTRDTAILLFNSATRSSYDADYAVNFNSTIYKMFVNLIFLVNCKNKREAFRSLSVTSGTHGKLPFNYYSEVERPLLIKWKGVMAELTNQRHRREYSNLIETCQEIIEYLSAPERAI